MSSTIKIGSLPVKGLKLKRGNDFSYPVQLFLSSKEGMDFISTKEKAAFAKGKEEGLQEGLATRSQDSETLIQALQKCLDQWKHVPVDMVKEIEPQVAELALAAGSLLVGRELLSGSVNLAALLEPVFSQVPGITRITIKLHPDDAEVLKDYVPAWQAGPMMENVSLEMDPAIGKGGCILDTNVGVIDMTLDTRMKALKDLAK